MAKGKPKGKRDKRDEKSSDERARRRHRPEERSLLDRAGVIGADALHPEDRGNPFIPESSASPGPPAPGSASEERNGPWDAAGIPGDEVRRWEAVAASPTTAATLRRLGVAPEVVGTAPVPADELVGWLWHGFAIDEVADWLAVGSVRHAARLRDAGVNPGDPP